MARIEKILHIENLGSYAKVHVLTDGQDEGVVFVGGEVEIYHDPKFDVTKVFVKKAVEKHKKDLT